MMCVVILMSIAAASSLVLATEGCLCAEVKQKISTQWWSTAEE
jgi:hypothetical protein